MKIYNNPTESEWERLLARPTFDSTSLFDTVRTILDDVKANGDDAVKSYEKKFDKVDLTDLAVSEKEIDEATQLIDEGLKKSILQAKENIHKFHSAQKLQLPDIEVMPGVRCWQKAKPIEKVGLYIPGGTAPLFSTVLMLAIPAQIAGCKEIVLCTPPSANGKIHPAVLFAAKCAGVSKIFKIGGTQAIAAMAYGTQSVPKVYKICGPGNQFVTAAKQLVSLKEVAIDMPAGPSEVEVLADETANPVFVASDLLSQAEHGVDSQAVMVTTSQTLAEKVMKEVAVQLEKLPRREIAERSIANSKILVVSDIEQAIRLTNAYAPEHLIISADKYREIAEKIANAGSIFLGYFTPESAGDYASGTNHTLPTNGYAKAYSGVNLDTFCKKITYQEITQGGLDSLGDTIETMASNEHLFAHQNAVVLRRTSSKIINQ